MPMTIAPTAPPTKQHHLNPSPFNEVTPRYSNEQIAAQLTSELKRMQRRRQICPYPQSGSPPPSSSSPPPSQMDSSMNHQPVSPSSSFFNALSPGKRDAPLFTFKQVSLLCDRLLKEREDLIRAEYDKVLTNKLAEQYEAFLKFNHDQLHRRMDERPASYVS